MRSQEHLGLDSRGALSPTWQLGSSMVDCPSLQNLTRLHSAPRRIVPLIQGVPGRCD
jgi:hypothetical protein